MKALSNTEISEFLTKNLKNWTFTGDSITRDLKFRTFTEAWSFMTGVALEAEKMDHHPDWKNVYNTVSIRLYTHSAGGITENDFNLAGKIDRAFERYQ
jgi:4a-hydroxytetrahydrobiopterin dehydratase